MTLVKSRDQLGGVFFYFLFILSDSGSEPITLALKYRFRTPLT